MIVQANMENDFRLGVECGNEASPQISSIYGDVSLYHHGSKVTLVSDNVHT